LQFTNVENLFVFEKKMKFCNRSWITSFFCCLDQSRLRNKNKIKE